jgi:2-polyprenyl-3-methyl-5-hydroxy-6-metoxy-1,4-benzoquinol methylase
MKSKEWFESWFDTTYYHSLYKNRDESEAKLFVSKLVHFLNPKTGTKVLDLACGKGRHSVTLNELGMNVLGVDLSQNSILKAKDFENETLKFDVHDMRQTIENHSFEIIFNLFTSFGYFDDYSDNEKVIQSIHSMLHPNGRLIIDFMNSEKVIQHLVTNESKVEDGITFKITRNYDGNHIFKHIQFEDKNEKFHFTERVQALKFNDFEKLLTDAGFEINESFGDFHLTNFNPQSSDRLIIIATKK